MPKTNAQINLPAGIPPLLADTLRRFSTSIVRDLTSIEQPVEQSALVDAATIVLETAWTRRYFEVTLTANRILDFQGHEKGRIFWLKLSQDGVGGRTVTWDADVVWVGGGTPTLSASAGAFDVFFFLDDGTNYVGTIVSAPSVFGPSGSTVNVTINHPNKTATVAALGMTTAGNVQVTQKPSSGGFVAHWVECQTNQFIVSVIAQAGAGNSFIFGCSIERLS